MPVGPQAQIYIPLGTQSHDSGLYRVLEPVGPAASLPVTVLLAAAATTPRGGEANVRDGARPLSSIESASVQAWLRASVSLTEAEAALAGNGCVLMTPVSVPLGE